MELWKILSANAAVDVFLPIILIVFGILALAVIPRRPNWFVGYRTSRACKNQETWVFAHRHFGRQLIIFSLVFVILSIERTLLRSADASSLLIGGIIVAQVVAILLALIPTEIALRKEFDKNGNRKG